MTYLGLRIWSEEELENVLSSSLWCFKSEQMQTQMMGGIQFSFLGKILQENFRVGLMILDQMKTENLKYFFNNNRKLRIRLFDVLIEQLNKYKGFMNGVSISDYAQVLQVLELFRKIIEGNENIEFALLT